MFLNIDFEVRNFAVTIRPAAEQIVCGLFFGQN